VKKKKPKPSNGIKVTDIEVCDYDDDVESGITILLLFKVKPFPKKVHYQYGKGRVFLPAESRQWRNKIVAAVKAKTASKKIDWPTMMLREVSMEVTSDFSGLNVAAWFGPKDRGPVSMVPDMDSLYHQLQDAMSKDLTGNSDAGVTEFLAYRQEGSQS